MLGYPAPSKGLLSFSSTGVGPLSTGDPPFFHSFKDAVTPAGCSLCSRLKGPRGRGARLQEMASFRGARLIPQEFSSVAKGQGLSALSKDRPTSPCCNLQIGAGRYAPASKPAPAADQSALRALYYTARRRPRDVPFFQPASCPAWPTCPLNGVRALSLLAVAIKPLPRFPAGFGPLDPQTPTHPARGPYFFGPGARNPLGFFGIEVL